MLRSTLLEVQVLYWMPLPGRSDETLQRNLTRTYSTSEGLIKLALDLEHKYAFLTHAPHFVFRSLFLAACTIVSYLRSPPFRPPSLDTTEEIDLVVQNVIKALKTCSVQAEDLPIRATNVMQGYWSVRDRLPPWDICQLRTAKFRHRLGASIMFECLSRWKRDIQRTRDASHAGGLPDANSGKLPFPSSQVWCLLLIVIYIDRLHQQAMLLSLSGRTWTWACLILCCRGLTGLRSWTTLSGTLLHA